MSIQVLLQCKKSFLVQSDAEFFLTKIYILSPADSEFSYYEHPAKMHKNLNNNEYSFTSKCS